MNDFIVGNDISQYQGKIDWNTYKNNANFVLIRSSYGVGNFDPWYGYNKSEVQKTNLPHGYYHYAYPQYNSPENEARWFITALSAITPLQEEEVLALDFEESAFTGDKVDWSKRFLDYVSTHFNGIKPLFYSYQDMVTGSDWTPLVNGGYALWIAAPTNDPQNNVFQTGKWPDAVMQQWGSQNNVPGIQATVDADIFFGTKDAFIAYGYKPVTPSPVETVTPAPSPVVTPPTPAPETPNPVPLPQTPLPQQPVPPGNSSVSPLEQVWQTILNFLKFLLRK